MAPRTNSLANTPSEMPYSEQRRGARIRAQIAPKKKKKGRPPATCFRRVARAIQRADASTGRSNVAKESATNRERGDPDLILQLAGKKRRTDLAGRTNTLIRRGGQARVPFIPCRRRERKSIRARGAGGGGRRAQVRWKEEA